MFTRAKKIVLFFGFLILAGSPACQQNPRLPEPLETNYAPSTQLSLPKGAKARLGKGWINGIEYSADGKQFAVTSSIGTWLYDTETLKELALFTNNKDFVWSGSFSPDGTRVATGVHKGSVHLWNATTGQLLNTLQDHTLRVAAISFSPDGTMFATGGYDGKLRIWNTATGEFLKGSKKHTKPYSCIKFSPDDRILATGTESKNHKESGTIYLWDVLTGATLHTIKEQHKGSVTSISFSPDGKTLVSACKDNSMRFWNVTTGKQIKMLKAHSSSNGIKGISFSPDRKTLASANYREVRFWDVDTGKLLKSIEVPSGNVKNIRFSPDGKILASASENEVHFWDVDTGKLRKTLKGHTGRVYSVQFSPDGLKIATGGDDGRARLWDATTGRLLTIFDRHASRVKSVHFSPDSKILASGSEDKTVRLWDIPTGKPLKTLEGHTGIVLSVDFSPDGRKIASGGWDRMVLLWDVTTGELLNTLPHDKIVSTVRFSPDGRKIVTDTNKLHLWNTATGKRSRIIASNLGSGVSFAPNGKQFVTGGHNKVHLFPVSMFGFTKTLKGTTSGWVENVCFSPDGRTIASANWNRTVTVWDVSAIEPLSIVAGHGSVVNEVSFSPDGRTIASASTDGTVLLWDVPQR